MLILALNARNVSIQTLASVLSCSFGHGDSGLPARNSLATQWAPTLTSATWRPRNSSLASPRRRSNASDRGLNVLPRQRVKDTRAAVFAKPPARPTSTPQRCSPSPKPKSLTTRKPRVNHPWAYRDTDDASDETTEEADTASRAEDDSLGLEPDADLDNLNSDENAHLDDEDRPIAQDRTRARRRYGAVE